MRKPLIAGNWKMNLTVAEALHLVTDIRKGINEGIARAVEVAVCPPYIYLHPLAEVLTGGTIDLGAQNVYHQRNGAFTGEISPSMLIGASAKFVIIGHSERRHTIENPEDDELINLKTKAATAAELIPILCVGETLAERESNNTLDVLSRQLKTGLANVQLRSPTTLVVAYEPVWAIGTGHNATPEQAQEAHAHIRNELRELYGTELADGLRILYGGSMKPDNAKELITKDDVDGGLIGGASLKADAFLGIIRAAMEAKA